MHNPADIHGNLVALEGVDRCYCGCKYWENDRCVDCGEKFDPRNLLDTESLRV